MTVPVDNGHLRYREAGGGPPVVLLHGGALDLRSWDDQLGPLSADHRVITPDARGHGGSSSATAPYRHCDDLAALLRALDTGPVTLVGRRGAAAGRVVRRRRGGRPRAARRSRRRSS